MEAGIPMRLSKRDQQAGSRLADRGTMPYDWLPMPYIAISGPVRPHQTCSYTLTEVDSTAATSTGNCSATTRRCAHRVAAATATIMHKLKASGRACKRKSYEVCERPFFTDLTGPQASVPEYFDYYNHKRLHTSIGYRTPYLAHQHLLQLSTLNCSA